jgi:haloalkane dehalogenase
LVLAGLPDDLARSEEADMGLSLEAQQFVNSVVHYAVTDTAKIAYRRFGRGDPLVLLHGWPLSGATFSKLTALLQHRFDCYIFDLPGCGQSEWTDETDFSIGGRAKILSEVLRDLGLRGYFLLAHNTGATIGRALALIEGDRIRKFVIINTEIPFHRPPWIPLYRRLLFLPASNFLFRQLIRSRIFVHSSMGFGECFHDRALLDGDFRELVIHPLLDSFSLMEGQSRALRGIDWSVVDGMAKSHQKISVPVLLVWGEEDRTFPIALARKVATQFPHCEGVRAVRQTKLLVHEEKPKEVAELVSEFFLRASAPTREE